MISLSSISKAYEMLSFINQIILQNTESIASEQNDSIPASLMEQNTES